MNVINCFAEQACCLWTSSTLEINGSNLLMRCLEKLETMVFITFGRNKELNSSMKLDSWATCMFGRTKFNHEHIPMHVYIYIKNINKSH